MLINLGFLQYWSHWF